jgi:DNA (cytosine-5)-methyltransferase 1
LEPLFVGVENSPELLGLGFGDVLGALASCGLDAEWDCIPAAALGAPHDRDRLWITAYSPELERVHELHLRKELRRWLSHHDNPWGSAAWDAPEAGIIGMDDGLPDRVDRSARLGNAVIPQIPEMIGRAILAAQGQAA